MVDGVFSLFSPASIYAYQNTARQIGVLQTHLSTGQRVSSPLDGADSFFTAASLSQRVVDLTARLDEVSAGLSALNTAKESLSSLASLLSGLKAGIQSGKGALLGDQVDFSEVILPDNPVAYYRLTDSGTATAANIGSTGSAIDGSYVGTYTQDAKALFIGLNNGAVKLDGAGGVSIPNHTDINSDPAGYTQRSIEAVFSAEDVSGRQVIYEEGGTSNAIALYIDNGNLHFEVNRNGVYGQFGINAPVAKGKSYHAALTFDSDAGEFKAYLNGKEVGAAAVGAALPTHNGAIAIGFKNGGTVYHDGGSGGDGDYFKGRVSDVAVYNGVLDEEKISERYAATLLRDVAALETRFRSTLADINPIVDTANYRGVNILRGGSLTFNLQDGEDTPFYEGGDDLRRENYGFSDPDFRTTGGIDRAIGQITRAITKIEETQSRVAGKLDVLGIRSEAINGTIAEAQSSITALTAVDVDETEARIQALQVRQSYQSLNLSSAASFTLLQSLSAPALFADQSSSVLGVLSDLSYLNSNSRSSTSSDE